MRPGLTDQQRRRNPLDRRGYFGSKVLLSIAIASSTLVACVTPLVGQGIDEGARVLSDGRDYSIQMLLAGWVEIPAATDVAAVESQPSLRIGAANGSGWIYGYRPIVVQPRLDEIVSERRRAMFAAGARDFQEKRYFLGDAAQITASLSRYAAGGEVYFILTAIRSALAVELVAATVRGGGAERDVINMLESIQFVEKPAASLP